MYSSNPLTPSDSLTPGQFYTLSEDVSAIQILPSNDRELVMSPVLKLPQGAEIATCGAGFDRQTRKVFCQGQFYYIFIRDFDNAFKVDLQLSN